MSECPSPGAVRDAVRANTTPAWAAFLVPQSCSNEPKKAPPQVWGSTTGPGDTLGWVFVAYSKILPRLLAGRLRKSRMGGIHKKGPAPGKQRPVSGAPHWRDPQSSQVRQVRILSLLRSGGHAKLRIGGLHQKKAPAEAVGKRQGLSGRRLSLNQPTLPKFTRPLAQAQKSPDRSRGR